MAFVGSILLPSDRELADRHFRVRFERFQWLAAPLPSHPPSLTPKLWLRAAHGQRQSGLPMNF